jgi:hypothetical protein
MSFTLKYPVSTLDVQTSSTEVATGSSITLTTLVSTPDNGVSVPPTGTVAFVSTLGPVAGTVAYSTVTDPSTGNPDLQASITFTPAASDVYSAQYSGDGNYGTGQGFSPHVAVDGNDFGLYLPTGTTTVTRGSGASLDLGVGVQFGAAAVTFSNSPCSGLPSEATCTVSPSSIGATSVATLSVGTTAPHASARAASLGTAPLLWSMGLSFAGIVLAGVPRRGKNKGKLLALFALAFLLVTSGCGGGSSSGGTSNVTDPGTPKGNYTVTVTGTSGSITHTATFTLTVQ